MTVADTSTETDPAEPATVVGMETDAVVGSRVRKSFSSRAFWGTVLSCYWVSGGLFYKVSFDDGDVDIFSADETIRDAKLAEKHSKEDPRHKKNEDASAEETVSYYSEMQRHSLKRKRDDPVDTSFNNVRRVTVWGQRLYATIFTNEQNETYIKELMKTEDGQEGELEATGQVQSGDLILAPKGLRYDNGEDTYLEVE
ncbi:hypothetical protein JM18_005060 [Phytophthora kernoviae]|uniref:Tudor domain-containing protein n=2 Tax=Phytophthora kernoviae TaxID=325452 RepID=A0A8T0LSV2_9STRA|nr:hypothetical protein G195_006454 [Phytophthora kernoviae 00238/432]KAG2520614.1 hypothetical protein JM16_005449 [Phytophthora kernoviae]KAG2522026.1 hypothetical protein JM18_005060 [Phytophthora kernoviae]